MLALVLATGVAGFADAFSLLTYGVFTANQSGNLIHVGMGLAGRFPDWPVALVSIFGFCLGGGLATRIRHRVRRHRCAPPGWELVAIIGVVVLWAVLARVLAPWDWRIGQHLVSAFVGAVAMGLLAVLFVRTSGAKTTTTYQSGTVLNIGEQFSDWIRRSHRRSRTARRWTMGFLGITCYAAGGGFGALLGDRPVWILAGSLVVLVVLLVIVRPPRFGTVD
ncbi:hypothetical protein GCM10027290_66070 [Micromonospora sonneratiae]